MTDHQQPSLVLSNSLASPATSSKEDVEHNQQTAAFASLSNLKRKIRVLLVATRLTIGGDMNVILDIASFLNSHPHFEVHLAVGPVPPQEVDLTYQANERGIPLVMIPSMVTDINPWRNLRSSAELYAHMRKGKYDIVHTHNAIAGAVGRLAAVLARVPVIIHHVHGWGLRDDMSKMVRLFYVGAERFCATFSSRLIAVSKPNIEKGLVNKICKEDKFALIYNGINLELFQQQVDKRAKCLELGLDPECKLVGMIGRLDKQKNPLDFIQAAAIVAESYPKAQFVMAGDGVLRPECEGLIKELHLAGKFFLLGYRNDINQIYPILTLTALSSLWEGLPVVFQESMIAGKPIVANDVDGARDVISDGKTGYLVTPHQPQEMADRILTLLNDNELCDQMGVTAKQHAKQYSSDGMVKQIVALYIEILTDCHGGDLSLA
ncbi:MAG: glycosyltransferase family 4 protein [Chloroflexota bacterium]